MRCGQHLQTKALMSDKKVSEKSLSLIYGRNSVEAYLLYAPEQVNELFLQEGLQKKNETHFMALAKAARIKITQWSKKTIEARVGKSAVHQGIVADIKPFAYAELGAVVQQTKKRGKMPFFLLLDQVQDPHNLGAILRTADCAGGVDGVIITKHHSAEVSASVIKASTGATLNIPLIQVTNARTCVQYMKREGIWLASLDMDGAVNYREQQYDLPLCLVIGGEDRGVRPIMKNEMDFNLYIPMYSTSVNSLNVSVAASLLLYEVAYTRAQQR